MLNTGITSITHVTLNATINAGKKQVSIPFTASDVLSVYPIYNYNFYLCPVIVAWQGTNVVIRQAFDYGSDMEYLVHVIYKP